MINNTSQSNKLEDCVFWYKAEQHGDFRIGSPEIWAHSNAHYKEKEEEDDGMNEIFAAKKMKGPPINIRKV